MPTLTKLPDAPLDTTPDDRVPGGWYDPDSSAFEPLAGRAAVTQELAASLEGDRRMETQTAEDRDTD